LEKSKKKKLTDTGFFGFGRILDNWFLFGYWTIDKSYQSTSVSKVMRQVNVHKSSSALFKLYGFYCENSKYAEWVCIKHDEVIVTLLK